MKAAPSRWSEKLCKKSAGPVPVQPYIDKDFFEREREKIFRKVWLNVCRVEEIPNPGDYIVKDLEILQTSIIVVRGKDGEVRAFHNMCSHRGNKVAIEPSGSAKGFTCFFHGWTYGTDGGLRGIADEKSFTGLCKEDLGLTPLSADIWEGFVFVNVNQEPEQTLAEYLGEYGTQMAGFPLSEMSDCYSWTAEVDVNWKVAKDAFAESYHVKALHRNSVAGALASTTNPFCHALDFHVYGPHQCISMGGSREYRPKPTSILAAQQSSKMKRYEATDEAKQLPPGVNPTRSEDWVFEITTIFPHMNLHFFLNSFTTYHFWPLSVDKTLWEVKQYYKPASNASDLFAQEVMKNLFRDTVLEDLSTLERTQSVLRSRAKDYFVLNEEEVLIRRFNEIVDEYVEA